MGLGRTKWSEQLIGRKFGRLTVIGVAPRHSNGRTQVQFRCDCGTEVVKTLTKVIQGKTRSCGCLKESSSRPTPCKKMLGRRYGKLLVVAQAPTLVAKNQGGASINQTRWVCQCDCGAQKTFTRGRLTGGTKSCGCLLQEVWKSAGCRLHEKLKGKRASNWKGVGDISKSFWNNILNGAKKRSKELEVTVTHQEVWDIFLAQHRKCALTGIPLQFAPVGTRSEGNASLDRIDSSKGYVTGNIQWVDKRIQQMKWNLPQPEFIELCRAVVCFQDAQRHPVKVK